MGWQTHGADTPGVVGRTGVQPRGRSGLAREPEQWALHQHPRQHFYYDTIEVAFNKRFSQKFFINTSADYQKRNELRSADIPDWGSTSPLATDPIGVGYFVNANPSVPNRQKTTMYHFQAMGRYTLPYRNRFRRQLPLSERVQLLERSSPTATRRRA